VALLHTLAQQTLGALAHAHSAGWAHCDVKLDNILGNAHLDTFVLADWGGAQRITAHGTWDGAAGARAPDKYPGTPAYMAPELVAGAASGSSWAVGVDLTRCDVYALGLTLLAVGLGAMWQLPRCVQGLVGAMLAQDPAARPSPATLLAAPYGQCADLA
jgi:serine/threonine protein kinase